MQSVYLCNVFHWEPPPKIRKRVENNENYRVKIIKAKKVIHKGGYVRMVADTN